MKELFLKVWHCVPLPAAAKPLAVSELPPVPCQQQDTSDGCRNFQKAKTSKTYFSPPYSKHDRTVFLVFAFQECNLT